MKRRGHDLRIFTVVEVWRGFAVGARSFTGLRKAQEYLRRLRRRHNLMDDDVQLFEGSVCISPRN